MATSRPYRLYNVIERTHHAILQEAASVQKEKSDSQWFVCKYCTLVPYLLEMLQSIRLLTIWFQ